ncbi:MAG: agmatine deiminase family protein [Thermoplasmatota archaeon]
MTWRLPAEWEPQERIWLVWPRDETTWPGDHLASARRAFVHAMQELAPQPVSLLAHPETASGARDAIQHLDHVTLVEAEHVDSWIRDYGPLTLLSEDKTRTLKFRFDAWGEKYETLMADDSVVERLAAAGHMPAPETIDFVLEGGAVETDGQGTFLATESVAAGRGQSLEEHHEALHRHLGAQHVIWLGDGIQGDDTDGHIDTITRFVGPATVVTTVAPKGHPDEPALTANLRRLRGATDAAGHALTIHTLPVPDAITTDDGEPLPAGHANFLIGNHAVLVPTYGGSSDAEALDVLGRCFPDWRVVGIDHRDLIWGFGGIHCLSMQIPASPRAAASDAMQG